MGSAHINTELDRAESCATSDCHVGCLRGLGRLLVTKILVEEPTTFYRRSLISVYDCQLLTFCFWSKKVANEKL